MAALLDRTTAIIMSITAAKVLFLAAMSAPIALSSIGNKSLRISATYLVVSAASKLASATAIQDMAIVTPVLQMAVKPISIQMSTFVVHVPMLLVNPKQTPIRLNASLGRATLTNVLPTSPIALLAVVVNPICCPVRAIAALVAPPAPVSASKTWPHIPVSRDYVPSLLVPADLTTAI